MATLVGLDLGTHTVTGAVFVGSAKRFRLVDFFREEIPRGAPAPPAGSPDKELTPAELAAPPTPEEIIRKILVDRGLVGADVVAAVDAKDCIIRELPVQFTRDEQIEKVIPYTAEEFLPTINIEDVVLEYLKVGEANGKSTVVLFALRNDLLESRLELLKRADIDPVAMDIDAAALFNAFALTPLYDRKKPTLLVDMGATSTKIVLVEEGRLTKVRAFRNMAQALGPERLLAQPATVGAAVPGGAGGDAEALFGDYSIESRFREIEEALRKLEPTTSDAVLDDFDESTPIAILSDEDYEKVQRTLGAEAHGGVRSAGSPPGSPSGGEGADGGDFPGLAGGPDRGGSGSRGGELRAYLERIGIEVQRTLASARVVPQLICLTGGMSGREEAVRYFTEELDVETIQFDLGDSVPTDLDAESLREVSRYGAVAVGLAVKELGGDRTYLDLRKGRFRYEHKFSKVKVPLLVASILCFALFLQTAFWSYHEYQKHKERAESYVQASREAYQAFFFDKPLAEGRDPMAAAKEQFGKWSGKGLKGVGKVLPYDLAIKSVSDVLNAALPELGDIFRLQSIDLYLELRTKPAAGGKKSELAASKNSSLQIFTKNDKAGLILERLFDKDEKVSKFFDANASSTKRQEEYQVTLELIPKKQVVKQFE